ncbi:MAG TPA: hypothetical protein VFQ63_02080 [Patescibacteria group bacterium]|nr:hypothetical protein [Patescibacteria group bacterium]
MEKKTISVHAFTVHIYTVAIVVLLLLLGILGLKYIHLKLAVKGFTNSAMWLNTQQEPVGSITDYATIVATTVGQYPQDKPLYTNPLSLENYVTTLSKELRRDIVVVDTTGKILADTVVANMGSKYSLDTKAEVSKTISDGLPRSFTETSKDYPQGISQQVVVFKNASGQTLGGVIVSNTLLSQ